jgi:hypothetical protein
MKVSHNLVEVLRSTIVQVEQTADLRPDDPAIVELKNSIVRTVAELEIAKLQKSTPKDQRRRACHSLAIGPPFA